jgi:ADP-ribose pyrophosphatase YjhB (NUDIX family)
VLFLQKNKGHKTMQQIKVKAFGLIKHQGKLLVEPIYEFGNTKGYRLLGGSVEHGETALEAVKREFLEELGAETTNHQLLKVCENIFKFEGKQGHEIVFIIGCDFTDQTLYATEHLSHADSANIGRTQHAYWLDPYNLPNNLPLWPEGIVDLL